jgi:formate hydrogenlyase subunit 6/NADH:ubiquinone oxidoreductase subunit I
MPRPALQELLDIFARRGYRCVGPQERDGAITYDTLGSVADLPKGVRDSQQPGQYRLSHGGDACLFAWANGPQALKPLLFAPAEPLWRAAKTDRGFTVETVLPETRPLAVIGVRACDLAALAIQDQIFLRGEHPDPYYAARRESLFLVAVNCTHPAATCFCVSTGDGPHAIAGFDLALTELEDGFTVEMGSRAGEQVLAELDLPPAAASRIEAANAAVRQAAACQVRTLPGRNLRDALFSNLHHARWDDVAARCLSCANCTLVCPTCFCHAEGDEPALDGGESVHQRQWDSCFSERHAYIHGFQVRPEIRHRYRQWLTHKLGSWHDQFGRSGCVGCGRCLAWCPAQIDLTEEAWAICAGSGDLEENN